jgi:class III cytochrome C family protein
VNRRFIAVLIILAIAVMGCSLAFAQAKKAPDSVVLKGAPMGGVKFDHKTHVTAAKKCDTCHHASKPEKASTSAQQNCTDCHTKVAAAPMKTKLQAAFHNPTATAGICIDCHKAPAAAGKAPTKCADCHKKENV